MGEKTRYSDDELAEFKEIILAKLDKAKEDYEILKSSITQSDNNDTQDTSPTFKVLEEGAATLSKEEAGKLAQRQLKFIQHLRYAMYTRMLTLIISIFHYKFNKTLIASTNRFLQHSKQNKPK